MTDAVKVPSSVDREVLESASVVRTSFEGIPSEPVVVPGPGVLRGAALDEIVARYQRHGFAVAQLPASSSDPQRLLDLASDLGVGPAFVPPLYATGRYVAGMVNKIAAQPKEAQDHPSFGRAVGLALHCDGTLQPIGLVATSMLLCHSPAAEGGENLLFNAVGAFADLSSCDEPAALALATPGVLVRQANMNGCSASHSGPIAAICEGRLVCCYSVSSTDRWELPDGVDPADLARGLAHMERAASGPGPHVAEVGLDFGQVLVLDNAVLSHGRRPYRDSWIEQRCFFRSLHLGRPGMAG
jgi:hypothetical protein